ncbi:MAG: glycosyltransferase [Thermoguttaceae bacterium]|nr:glycosyltransferase [Thermoguttaceae bacterium]
MERSLSLLLPVRNAQATLSETVHRILEVASDLTDRFELIIIDDGSTDATSEVAEDLKRNYPQIRAVRHGQPRGEQESLRSGLRMSSGRIVLCRDPAVQLAVEELPRVWKSLAAGRIPPPPDCSYRLVDRRTGQQLHGPSRPTRPNFLAQVRKFALGE